MPENKITKKGLEPANHRGVITTINGDVTKEEFIENLKSFQKRGGADVVNKRKQDLEEFLDNIDMRACFAVEVIQKAQDTFMGTIKVDYDELSTWWADLSDLAYINNKLYHFEGFGYELLKENDPRFVNNIDGFISKFGSILDLTDIRNELRVKFKPLQAVKNLNVAPSNYTACANGFLKFDFEKHTAEWSTNTDKARKLGITFTLPEFNFNPEYLKPEKRAPDLWLRYTGTMLGENSEAWLQFYGSTAFNDYRSNTIMVWQSFGGSGKSFYATHAIKPLLSKTYEARMQSLFKFNGGQNFDLQNLMGMALVYDDDMTSARLEPSDVKKITGDTMISAEVKNQNEPLKFKNVAKVFMLVNEKMPRFVTDSGVERRVVALKVLTTAEQTAQDKFKKLFNDQDLNDTVDDFLSFAIMQALKTEGRVYPESNSIADFKQNDYLQDFLDIAVTSSKEPGVNGVALGDLAKAYSAYLRGESAVVEGRLTNKELKNRLSVQKGVNFNEKPMRGSAKLTSDEQVTTPTQMKSRNRLVGLVLTEEGADLLNSADEFQR